DADSGSEVNRIVKQMLQFSDETTQSITVGSSASVLPEQSTTCTIARSPLGQGRSIGGGHPSTTSPT
ncbi:unnamed protein product, partial [Amoebophrya sp. A25]